MGKWWDAFARASDDLADKRAGKEYYDYVAAVIAEDKEKLKA